MGRTLLFVSTLFLAAPLALAQVPGPPPNGDGGAMSGPPGASARRPGPDHGMRGYAGRDGRGPREDRMHDGGPDSLAGMHVPPGTWWRNPEVVSRVGLSADQVKRIDGIFLESKVQLIHMHASLEEEQLRLEPLLAANPVNQQAALEQISKVADTRADLEKANAKMLLTIRGVLTGEQWTKLQQRPMGPRGMDGRGDHGHRPDAPPAQPGSPAE